MGLFCGLQGLRFVFWGLEVYVRPMLGFLSVILEAVGFSSGSWRGSRTILSGVQSVCLLVGVQRGPPSTLHPKSGFRQFKI